VHATLYAYGFVPNINHDLYPLTPLQTLPLVYGDERGRSDNGRGGFVTDLVVFLVLM